MLKTEQEQHNKAVHVSFIGTDFGLKLQYSFKVDKVIVQDNMISRLPLYYLFELIRNFLVL